MKLSNRSRALQCDYATTLITERYAKWEKAVAETAEKKTVNAIKTMKNDQAAGLDCAITAEALRGAGYVMASAVHAFCYKVFVTLTPPEQWTTNIIVLLPKKGDLSLMSNYRGISLMSIATKVYNKILLTMIREHVDPILRNNQAGFRQGRSKYTFSTGSLKPSKPTNYRL
ncbi:hypothetical protein Bbelb_276120 [Branchiostoma belcheri]|nr:hypothetical protein Bbelb_276120 [Branchiostoma belcheri]